MSSYDENTTLICLSNIGPREQRRRLMIGIIGFAFSAGLAIALILAGVDHLWRLVVVLPLYGGAVGYFQARDKT